jgi:hypothetical protein
MEGKLAASTDDRDAEQEMSDGNELAGKDEKGAKQAALSL